MSSTTDTSSVEDASQTASLVGEARRRLEDGRLSRQAAAGSQTAFARIYERHHQELWRYSLSLLRNDEDAKDALQSTFERALAAIDEQRNHGSLRPWLFRIVHNESISLLRRRKGHQDVEELSLAAVSDVEQEVGTRAELEQLVRDLSHLSDQERGALLMREASGLDYDTIARALEISSAAAKQSVYAARTSLREYEKGRAMECEVVRHALSGEDRRTLRGRRLQAHVRGCEECRGFQESVRLRRRQLLALAPPLDGVAAASVLGAVLNGSKGGGGAAAGGVGTGTAVVTSVAAKSAIAIVAAAVVTGAGAVGVSRVAGTAEAPPSPGGDTGPALPMRPAPPSSGATRGPAKSNSAERRSAPADGGRAFPRLEASYPIATALTLPTSSPDDGASVPSAPSAAGTPSPSKADDVPGAGSAPGGSGSSPGKGEPDLGGLNGGRPVRTEGEGRLPVTLPTPSEVLDRLPEVPAVSAPTVEGPALPSTPSLPAVPEEPVTLPVVDPAEVTVPSL